MIKTDLTKSYSKSHLHGCGIVESLDNIYGFYDGYFIKANLKILTGYEIYKARYQEGKIFKTVNSQLRTDIINTIEQNGEREYINNFVKRLINEGNYLVTVTSIDDK